MSVWGCGSPACCCQPAVAGGFIYADLRNELFTHLAPRICLLRVLLGVTATVKSVPLSKHTGFLRSECLFTLHMGSGSSPLSCGVFLSPPLLQAFLLLVAGWVPLLLPSLARLFIYSYLRDFPSSPLQCSWHPALFGMCLFYCYCLLFSFFFVFPWVEVGLSRGLCWAGPGLSVGVPDVA
jgi:hypothetical protein